MTHEQERTCSTCGKYDYKKVQKGTLYSVRAPDGREVASNMEEIFADNLIERLDCGHVTDENGQLACACCEGPLAPNGTCVESCCGKEDWPFGLQT